jgi:uncharacterized protein (TIGR02145 family)
MSFNSSLWRGRTLLLAAAAVVGAVCMVCISGCSDKGTGPTAATYSVQVESEGDGATGAGKYEGGTEVTIFAGKAPTGKKFKNWTASVSSVVFADAGSDSTTFLMPAKDVKVTAVFEGSGPSNPTTPNTFMLTVSGGGAGATKNGAYAAGSDVTIFAGTVAGKNFIKWTADAGSGVRFDDAEKATTTFTMPSRNVTVIAKFEGPDGDGVTMYKVEVSSKGTGASGDGNYAAGDPVTINAGTVNGQNFKHWTSSIADVIFADSKSATTTFIMPAKNVSVIATFEGSTTDNTKYTVTVLSDASGATGDGDYATGVQVTISAGTAPTGTQFKNWTSKSKGVSFDNDGSSTTTFSMPANDVEVTAVFETKTDQTPKYTVTVSSESKGADLFGTGSHEAGTTVVISVKKPPIGQQFKNWTSTNSSVSIEKSNSATTTFTMPPSNVTVTANFEYVVTDIRDGQKYPTVVINDKAWTAKNINFEATTGSWCYGDDPKNCEKYGRLYDWEAATTACPPGWHLPTRQEWGDLAVFAGGTGDDGEKGEVAGKKLRAKSGWDDSEWGNGTDDYGFAALPGGSRRYDNTEFINVGKVGIWWTSTSPKDGEAISRSMGNAVVLGQNYTTAAFAVRCVQSD